MFQQGEGSHETIREHGEIHIFDRIGGWMQGRIRQSPLRVENQDSGTKFRGQEAAHTSPSDSTSSKNKDEPVTITTIITTIIGMLVA